MPNTMMKAITVSVLMVSPARGNMRSAPAKAIGTPAATHIARRKRRKRASTGSVASNATAASNAKMGSDSRKTSQGQRVAS